MNHGTVSCYNHKKCRCALCVAAKAESKRTWSSRQGRTPRVPPPPLADIPLDEVFADQIARIRQNLAGMGRRARNRVLEEVSDDKNDLDFEVKR